MLPSPKMSTKILKVPCLRAQWRSKTMICSETLCAALGTQNQIFRAKRQFPALYFIAHVYTRRKIATQSTQVGNYDTLKMFRRHAARVCSTTIFLHL